jgi:hypothetical protein
MGARDRYGSSRSADLPIDGPVSRYFYHHTEPVVPAWWLTDEILPSIERAIASYHGGKR